MSDDDFQSKPSTKLSVPQRLKVGEELLLVDSKWKGSQFLEKIREQFHNVPGFEMKFVSKAKSNRYHPDLEFPGLGPLNSLSILILIEMDYLGGSKAYKQKVAQFFEAKRRNRAIVFCLRSELSANDFLNVQDFVAIEIGLAMIPLSDLERLPQMLSQLYLVEKGGKKRPNPFKFGAKKKILSEDEQMVHTVQSIPGLDAKRARQLLESKSMNNLSAISQATFPDLCKIVDAKTARIVHNFFQLKTT